MTLVDAFADIDKGEAWLHQMDIGVYAFSHGRNHEPRRKRKLLLHRREIDRLVGKIREKSYTLVPLSLYEKKGRVKAELALVHGKQSWDKREDSKKRESSVRSIAPWRAVAAGSLLLLACSSGTVTPRDGSYEPMPQEPMPVDAGGEADGPMPVDGAQCSAVIASRTDEGAKHIACTSTPAT